METFFCLFSYGGNEWISKVHKYVHVIYPIINVDIIKYFQPSAILLFDVERRVKISSCNKTIYFKKNYLISKTYRA